MSMKEFDDENCVSCYVLMDINATQLRPTWSDHYDNVVCLTCAEGVLPRA